MVQQGDGTGEKRITVDGSSIQGDVVPLSPRKTVAVEVTV